MYFKIFKDKEGMGRELWVGSVALLTYKSRGYNLLILSQAS